MEMVSPEPRYLAGARQAGFYAPTSVWNVTNTETMRSGHRAAVPNTRIRAPSQIFDLAYKMSYTSHERAVRNLLFLSTTPRKECHCLEMSDAQARRLRSNDFEASVMI